MHRALYCGERLIRLCGASRALSMKIHCAIFFGSDVVATVSAALSSYPDEVFNKSVSEFNVNHSSSAVNAIVTVGSAIAETVAANSTYLQRIAPACLFDTTGAVTLAADSCTQNFISAVGLKIYRRPLSAAEVSTYLTTLKTPTTAAVGNSESVAILLGQMLLQPEMIFHFAYSKTLVDSRYKLDPYTVASRLSYRVIGTAPDDTLLAAAQNGQLGSTQLLQAQALRLFQKTVPSAQSSYIDNPGRRFVRHFYSQWLSMPLARIPDINYASIFGVSQGGLKDGIIGEAMTFGEYVTMDSAGDFNDLMNSNMAFPPTADVAKIMGTDVSAGAGDPKPVADARRGLFERPILMLDETTRESPEHRGAQFLRMATCTDLGDPPPDASTVATQVTQALNMLQMTDGQIAKAIHKLARMSGDVTQASIHPDFCLKSFGPFGEYRTTENTYDLNNNLVASLPINASTVMTLDGTPVAMSGPDILGPTLAKSKFKLKACMAQELFSLDPISG